MENKQFRLKRIRSQIRRLFPVVFLLVAIVLMVLWQTKNSFVSGIRLSVTDTLTPTVNWLSAPARWLKAGKDYFLNVALLYRRNEELEQENKRLRSWRALALQLQAEQNEIKKMVGYVAYPKAKVSVARLVMDTGDKFSRSYIALAGSKDGITNGTVALTDKGLFGRVIDVGDHGARLMLLTDYLSRVPVLVGEKRVSAVLSGDNTNAPKVIFSDQSDLIQEGDIVLTSGYMGVYPSGLSVGIIHSKTEEEITVELFEKGEGMEFVQLVDFGLSQALLRTDCKE